VIKFAKSFPDMSNSLNQQLYDSRENGVTREYVHGVFNVAAVVGKKTCFKPR